MAHRTSPSAAATSRSSARPAVRSSVGSSATVVPLFDAPPAVVISCDDCPMAATDACGDCLVPFLLAGDEGSSAADEAAGAPVGPVAVPVTLAAGEVATVRLLQRAGLAPELRHPRHAPLLADIGGRG